MKSIIKLTAEAELEDKEAREQLSMLWTKIETLNERTKRQTLQIRDLNRELKKLTKK